MDKRKYLDPTIVAKIDNMALRARLVVEGYLIGQHKSPYHGFSVEFAEHRAYGHGDEIRHIDWKLYGKTDRYYVKRYEEETNLRSYILLDTSLSMTYGSGSISKLEYASYLSAAITHLMLNQRDGMGLVLFDEKIRKFIPPRAAPSHANIIMGALDNIISDLLDDPEQVLMGLNHFRHNKQEMIVFHLLDRQEQVFQFGNRTKFRDLETGETITTEPWYIRSAYQKVVESFQRKYQLGCRNQRIDYVPLFTDQPLDIALNEYLNKRKRTG